MRFLRWHAVAWFAAALSVTPLAVQSQSIPPGTTDGESAPPAVELTPRLLFQILAAELALQRGEVRAAWSTSLSVARQTRDPRLARRATEIALGARALAEATESAQFWLELSPGSGAAAQIAETLLLAGRQPEAAESLVNARLARARQEGQLPQAYDELQRHLGRSPDTASAWRLLQRLSAPDLQIPQARLARATLAAAAQEAQAARAELSAALALAPDSTAVALSAARLLATRLQSREDALALLERTAVRAPKDPEVPELRARVLVALGRETEALEQFSQALALNPKESGLLLAAGQLAQQLRRTAQARQHIDAYLALPTEARREREQALLLRARIAEDEQKPDEALRWLERIPQGDLHLVALTRRATLLARSGRLEQARALLQSEPAEDDEARARLISAEASAWREAGLETLSFEVLDQAVRRFPDRIDLLYDHGMAAERVDRIDVMEQSMKRVIALKPDHAHAHNALGYTWADRNIRLEEARTLIGRAVELSPDDGHILDSMGWVLFRQRDLPGALEWLNKAWALSPDAEIGAHLGEVLWTLGRREQALQIWRQARARDPDNKVLASTIKRLGAHP
jgi:tetratricopeptide (TPR) repeat protein